MQASHPLLAGLVMGAGALSLASPVLAQDGRMRSDHAPQATAAPPAATLPSQSPPPASVPPTDSTATPPAPDDSVPVRSDRPVLPGVRDERYVTAQTTPSESPAAATTTTTAFDNSRYSLLPGTSGGYVGLNIGKPEYSSSCGNDATLACSDPGTAARLYTGGMFNQNFGVELGYTDFGKADRAGGQVHSRAFDLSALGRVPLASSFSVYGKLGASYGRTTVSAASGTGVATGTESGWGPNGGAGISFDLTPQFAVLAEWDRHDLRFPGGDREKVTSNNLGAKYFF